MEFQNKTQRTQSFTIIKNLTYSVVSNKELGFADI